MIRVSIYDVNRSPLPPFNRCADADCTTCKAECLIDEAGL